MVIPMPTCGWNVYPNGEFYWWWDEVICNGPDPGPSDPPLLANNRRVTLTLHMAPTQWVSLPDGTRVPKITGRHETAPNSRQIADSGDRLAQVALGVDGALYHDGRGKTLELFATGWPISSILETGWIYPNGPQGEFLTKTMSWYHGSWNPSAVVDLLTLTRRDRTGVVQTHIRNTRPFESRVDWFWVFRGGQAMKIQIKSIGKNYSLSSSTIGPIQLEVAEMGDHQEE